MARRLIQMDPPKSLPYNFRIVTGFRVNSNGTGGETRLTNTGYTQGFPSWSHAGDKIVYLVSAINGEGKYDLYLMNADGTGNRNVTPDYFPPEFLCHAAIFSKGDSDLYFIGEWYP